MVTALSLAANAEERVQLWQYQPEQPIEDSVQGPSVVATQWRQGDLEVLFTQSAPCGEWLPVNPQWQIDGWSVQLNFLWIKRYPQDPAPTKLCKKFVKAWVFGVPDGSYKVTFGKTVQRFKVAAGGIAVSEGAK